ncbi:MAG TPA: GntR family transcriptional regulator [Chitinophagaceae bacterium]|nr:GntR family transcriptional regulator [Chitinophagaceae bacterium]
MSTQKPADHNETNPAKTMAEVVEVQLREYFRKRSFKPGDALPTELELAQALDVSRNVIREALSRFRMLGIIETRKKRGMVVSNPDILGAFEKVLDPHIIDAATLQDIFEIRLTLEMGLADLLYLRKTKKDVKELEEIALNEKARNKEDAFRIESEIAFHGKIYQMTGNNTLKRFQGMLLPVFGYIVANEKKPITCKVTHLDLVNILKTGSKEDFRMGMHEHLAHHFESLRGIAD